MPIHDWTRVTAGVFHDFHHDWITMLKRQLNAGRLPSGYYAMAEQVAGGPIPDVIALEENVKESSGPGENESASNLVALAEAPPKVQLVAQSEVDLLTLRKNRIAVRHSSDDRVVALIEIVSPGNKSSRYAVRSFVDKAIGFLAEGVHLLVIDLFPPGRRDPQGIHGAIWSEIEDSDFQLPPNKPLTLAAYSAGPLKRAFVEFVAVGEELPDMPLFLQTESYVPAPLAASYQAAWDGVPARWHARLSKPV